MLCCSAPVCKPGWSSSRLRPGSFGLVPLPLIAAISCCRILAGVSGGVGKNDSDSSDSAEDTGDESPESAVKATGSPARSAPLSTVSTAATSSGEPRTTPELPKRSLSISASTCPEPGMLRLPRLRLPSLRLPPWLRLLSPPPWLRLPSPPWLRLPSLRLPPLEVRRASELVAAASCFRNIAFSSLSSTVSFRRSSASLAKWSASASKRFRSLWSFSLRLRGNSHVPLAGRDNSSDPSAAIAFLEAVKNYSRGETRVQLSCQSPLKR